MLAVAATELPTAGDWVYEVKWDGYRVIAAVEGGERDAAQPQRQRPDRALRPGGAARCRRALRSADCVLDGEVCALDEDGRPRFSLLQHGGGALAMYVFDLLRLDGRDVTGLPLHERRELLAGTLIPGEVIRLSVAFARRPGAARAVAAAGARGRGRQARLEPLPARAGAASPG